MNSRLSAFYSKIEDDPIDFNFAPQLLLNVEVEEYVVLTNGLHTETNFEGTIVYSENNKTYPVGGFKDFWNKKHFKKLSDSMFIQLSN